MEMPGGQKEKDLIIVINDKFFYKGPVLLDNKRLIYTDDENYHVDLDEDLEKACWRIYDMWYADKSEKSPQPSEIYKG